MHIAASQSKRKELKEREGIESNKPTNEDRKKQ